MQQILFLAILLQKYFDTIIIFQRIFYHKVYHHLNLLQISSISLWVAIIPMLIILCALLAIGNICWNYWHGKRPLTKILWFSTVSNRRTGEKNILGEHFYGTYKFKWALQSQLYIPFYFFLDTSSNQNPIDDNVSFTVLSPNFNESIPMTMETNPAYISISLPIRVMQPFGNL